MTATLLTTFTAAALFAAYWVMYHRPKQRKSQRQISQIETIAQEVSSAVDLFRMYQSMVFKQIDTKSVATNELRQRLISTTNSMVQITQDLKRHESTLRILGDTQLADHLRVFCHSILFFRHQLNRYKQKQVGLDDLHIARDQVLQAQELFYQQIAKGYNQALSRI